MESLTQVVDMLSKTEVRSNDKPKLLICDKQGNIYLPIQIYNEFLVVSLLGLKMITIYQIYEVSIDLKVRRFNVSKFKRIIVGYNLRNDIFGIHPQITDVHGNE